jgi:hypothetical protein
MVPHRSVSQVLVPVSQLRMVLKINQKYVWNSLVLRKLLISYLNPLRREKNAHLMLLRGRFRSFYSSFSELGMVFKNKKRFRSV